MPQNITQDKLKITGTYTGTKKLSYEIRITPLNNESDPGGGGGTVGYSLFKWRVTNIDRVVYLKFISGDATVITRTFNQDGTYSNDLVGLPLFIGDRVKEVSGGGNWDDGSSGRTIASINTGTEGVNVTSFEMSAAADSTVEAKAKYTAEYKTNSSDAVPRLCSEHPDDDNLVTHNHLYGLTFYFDHTNMASDFYSTASSPDQSDSYYFYTFTAYPQKDFNADKITRVVRNGQHNIVAWDSQSKRLSQIIDIYRDNLSADNISGQLEPLTYHRKINNTPCFSTRGDDTYIGTGNNSQSIFAGHPNITQFGKKMGEELVIQEGPVIVNTSVLPQFEQFVFTKTSGSTTLASIAVADWDITASAAVIVGYEEGGSYLVKATKLKGAESSFYCGGPISAIRLDLINTNMVWVLVNTGTYYKILKIAIGASETDMAIDSNKIYTATRTTTNLLPEAGSADVQLTDIIVLDDIIYLQASDTNIDIKGINECIFDNTGDKQAYIWRSASVSGDPGTLPNQGFHTLAFTDMTPSMTPNTESSGSVNTEYDPYWYRWTERVIAVHGTGGMTGSDEILNEGIVPVEELSGEEWLIKQALPKRGLFIYNADDGLEAIGLMIPYVKNSSLNPAYGSFIEEINKVGPNSSVSGSTTTITTDTTYRVGPLVKQTGHVILGAHMQIFHDAEVCISPRGETSSASYTGVKRIMCSTNSDTLYSTSYNIGSGNPSFDGIDIRGDGDNFESFSSITTVHWDNLYIWPRAIIVGYGTQIIIWDLHQNLTTLQVQGDGSGSEGDYNITTNSFSPTSLSKHCYLSQGPDSIVHKVFSPSNISAEVDSESEGVSPINIASQVVALTNLTTDITTNVAVNFPRGNFGIYYKAGIEGLESGVDWSKLSIKSSIELSIDSAGGSEYNLTNLKVDATFDDPEEGSDTATAYEDSNFYHNFYRVSVLYDGYQESCLSNTRYEASTNPNKLGHELTLRVKTGRLNKRLSHVNIYRARSSLSTNPEFDWLLVKSIALDGDGWISPTASAGEATLEYKFKDIVGANFGTYEALTGISPAMSINYLSYSISEECAGYLFVTNAKNMEITNTGNYIFRSKPGKFNIFNWANEYCSLPEKVNALQSYNNLLYAFSSAAVYTINPNNLSIIDKMEGQGVLADDSVIATDYGMFFADKYGAYVHNGKNSVKISLPIQESDNASLSSLDWNSIDWETNPVKLAFDSQRKSVFFFFISGSNSYAWVYSVIQKRWDLWSFDNKIQSITQGKFGEIIASDGRLLQIGTGTTRKAWEFQSKKITAGFDTYEKQFKEVHAEGTSGLAVKYKTGLASGVWNALTSAGSGRLSSANNKSKWLQIQVIDSAGTRQLESLGIHLRPLKARSTKI